MASPEIGPDRWRGALEPSSAARPDTASAVLLLLVHDLGEWSVLLTARSRRLSQHAGQLSFPGGRIEPTDPSPLEAALRETTEEIGVPPSAITVLGQLPSYTTFRDAKLAAYVGEVAVASLKDLSRRSEEVEEVLLVPLSGLLGARGVERAEPGRRRFSRAAVVTRARVDHYYGLLAVEPRAERLIHYWRLDNGHTLWGITGDLVAMFLSRCFGWTPPSSPRRVTERGDVLPDADD